MYKLLIVDDEKTTRDSLRDFIPWDELEIGEVAVARNGIEALEAARQMRPDILLSDIRMPKMDGLELGRQIRSLCPDCQIVYLSGYADKEYLKTAIQLKAVNYIEKPINPDEIVSVIRETVSVCNAESQRRTAIDRLKNAVRGSQPLVRQEIALELIKDNTVVADLIAKYGELPFQTSAAGYTAACLTLQWADNPASKDITAHQQFLLQLFSDETFGDPAGFTAGFDPQNRLVFIAAARTGYTPAPGSRPIWNRLLETLNAQSRGRFRCAIGVGGAAATLAQIPASYRSALQAVSRRFYEGFNRIYFDAAAPAGRPVEIDRRFFASFKEILQKNDLPAAQEQLRELAHLIGSGQDPDVNRVKNVFFHMLLLIFEVALERGLIDPFSPTEQSYIWREVDAIQSLEELAAYALSCVQSIYIRTDAAEAANQKISEIRRYILENYGHQDLTVQTVAAHVYLSPTYLCALYKKTTGQTLGEFLTDTRIDKARELLADRRLKLYEIARRVGFTDVNYFSTLFKRWAGCTPSEFRARAREKFCR